MSDHERMIQHFAELDEYMAEAVREARDGNSSPCGRLRKDGYSKLADELEESFGL